MGVASSLRMLWRPRWLGLLQLAAGVTAKNVYAPITSSASSSTATPTSIPTLTFSNSSTCSADCFAEAPILVEYTWSPVSYEAYTTHEYVVATLVYIINDATNETSTSTEYAPSTLTEGLQPPGATQTASVVYERAPGDTVTTTVTYPTPYIDYGAQYFIDFGTLPTNGVCKTYSTLASIEPSSHIPCPTPPSMIATNKSDPLGMYYSLVSVESPDLNIGTVHFDDFYVSAYTDQAALVSCQLPVPVATEVSSAFTPSATLSLTLTSEGQSEGPSESPQPPLTHTSVSFLTAQTTRHVNIPPFSTTPESQLGPPTKSGGDYTRSRPPQNSPPHSRPPGGSPPRGSSPGETGLSPTTTSPPAIGIGMFTFSPSPTYVSSTPAIIVDGHTIELGGGEVDIHGTPVGLTVVQSGGSIITEAIVGSGGPSASSIPIVWSPASPTGPEIALCGSDVHLTPTAVVQNAETVPAIVADGTTVLLGGDQQDICGTPVSLTVVASGTASVIEAVIGNGNGQSTVVVAWPTSSSGLGGYIISGLGGDGSGGGAQSTSSGSSSGAAALRADVLLTGDIFGLVLAGFVVLWI